MMPVTLRAASLLGGDPATFSVNWTKAASLYLRNFSEGRPRNSRIIHRNAPTEYADGKYADSRHGEDHARSRPRASVPRSRGIIPRRPPRYRASIISFLLTSVSIDRDVTVVADALSHIFTARLVGSMTKTCRTRRVLRVLCR